MWGDLLIICVCGKYDPHVRTNAKQQAKATGYSEGVNITLIGLAMVMLLVAPTLAHVMGGAQD